MDERLTLSRRTFLRQCGAGVIGGGVVSALTGGPGSRAWATANGRDPDESISISIIHTTDLHGRVLGDAVRGFGPDVGGLARCATVIRRWRAENPNTILLDVGDTLQGTDVGWRSGGEIMIDCMNALRYDGWVLGNHEFDWGLDPVHNALLRFEAPVIGTNLLLEGRTPEAFDEPGHPLSRIAGHHIVHVGGVRIGLLGFTTPGMPYWFPESFHAGMRFLDCAEPARRGEAALQSVGIEALVMFGHMGLREEGDNQSNQVRALCAACPTAAAYIGAHSHRLHEADQVGEVLYTQANFWGSHVGRLDLDIDRTTGRLLGRRTEMAFVGPDVEPDPVILDLCRDRLEFSEKALTQRVGRFLRPLSSESAPGRPSDVERLIAAAMQESLGEAGVHVDGVIHGVLGRPGQIAAGDVTLRDLWRIVPFENFTMTAALTPGEIAEILDESFAGSHRNLMGLRAETVMGIDGRVHVARIGDSSRGPLDENRRYVIAFNTWDAQSGGGRLMRLREVLARAECRRTLHRVQTRQALIEFMLRLGDVDVARLG